MAKIVGVGSAKETLIGTAEDDIIIGGPGTNILYGKGGADTFVIKANLITTKSSTYDTIKDFQVGVDKVDLSVLGVSSWSQLQLLLHHDATSVGFGVQYNKVQHTLTMSNVTFSQLSADDFIFDTSGPRVLAGTKYIDNLLGSAGDDTLTGGVSDTVLGGDGNDTLSGSGTLYGGDGNDTINSSDVAYGGKGNDTLICDSSAYLYGDSGRDIFKFGERLVTQYGSTYGNIEDFNNGVDKIDISEFQIYNFDQLKLILEPSSSGGFAYFDAYYGAGEYYSYNHHEVKIRNMKIGDLSASDFIFTSSAVKPKNGTAQNDRIFGSDAAETLSAGAGSDEVFAGAGDDIIIDGKGGWNTLYGMAGADTFKLGARFYTEVGGTWDVIGDFEVGKDKVDVSALGISDFEQLQLIFETRNGKDTVFDAYTAEEFSFGATLKNIAIADLKASDFIFDTAGARNQTGIRYSERMFGSGEGEKINGAGGNDELYGGGGNDHLLGGEGDDKLFGGSGNDILDGGTGANFLYGGAGTDTFILSNVYLSRTTLGDFEIGVDRFDLSILGISSLDQLQTILKSENSTDTGFNIWINDSFVDVTWKNIPLASLTAHDFIFSKSGALNLAGTNGDDYYFGSVKADILKGGAGSDKLLGGDGNDTLDGGDYNDLLYGGAGNDKILGGTGNDAIYTGLGKDTVDGGEGLDTVYFLSSVTLDFTNPANSTGEAQFTTYTSIEAFRGSAAADRMTGGALDDSFYGEAGNDILKGMGGNDRLQGGNGDDRLDGGDANDKVFGGAGNDRLYGGAGKDQIDGGYGDDLIIASTFDDVNGGVWGSDTVDFSKPVSLNLLDSSLNTGEAEGSHYHEIEIFDGSTGADIMVGNGYAQTFIGGGGDDALAGMDNLDVLLGGDGDDLLYGGLDTDALTGGNGADVFLYNYVSDSKVAEAARDTIYDFLGKDGDRIDLSNIDANTKISGDQAFSYVGTTAFTGKAGELRYEKAASDTYIYADTNGDKKADFSIHLDDAVTLSKGYFVL